MQRTVVVLSIVVQTLNQQCNALGVINGIFFHACVTPDKVIKALAHMGVSISLDTINNTVKLLSRERTEAIAALGQTLTSASVYDNFEIKLHPVTPTIENPGQDLLHLTARDVFQLKHGVTSEDLRCSRALWAKSRLNSSAAAPVYGFEDLLTLQHEVPHPNGPGQRARYNTWKFMYDLTHHGPSYFRQFAGAIGRPEAIEAIPVVKLRHHPVRTMELNNSTVDGNISAIETLCAQAGLGDPKADATSIDVVDVSEYVILFHGDLGTMERVQSALRARSIEATAWRRLQFVIFVPGIYHFQMACVDGVWRTFIKVKTARGDNSLIQYIGFMRPNETGKFLKNPTFRQMNDAIQHIGIVLRLDAWRVEALRCERCHGAEMYKSLEAWAEDKKPGLDDLWAAAAQLA